MFHGRGIYDFAGTARVNFARLRHPYAVWIAGIEVWEEFRKSRESALASAHDIFAISDFTRNRALDLHGDMFARARVCWLGTHDDDAGEVSPARANGPPTCLIVARMERGRDKGHEALIASWSRVVSVVPDARLVIAGAGGHLEYFRKKAAASPAAGNIDFLGFVSEADLSRLYAEATVFAMPSWGEGFGLVYIEAMRHRVPVIASTHDAGQEVNLDGVSGYNIDMRRPDDLAERLIALLGSRDLAARLGQQAFERWRDNFCYSRFRDRFRPLAMDFMTS
jgi:phosphatidylinositol alpha-1,6-mannosyltransferase